MRGDIGIYMKGSTLAHKIAMVDDPSTVVWWSLKRIPIEWANPHYWSYDKSYRLYVASGNRWLGYFVIHPGDYELDGVSNNINIMLYGWHFIREKGIPHYDSIGQRITLFRKPFRGFTYSVPERCYG